MESLPIVALDIFAHLDVPTPSDKGGSSFFSVK